MYAARGMRNTIAIATVRVVAAAMCTTARPRPSLGASSRARKARSGARASGSLTRVAMMNFDGGRHADMQRLGRRVVKVDPDRKSLRHDHPVQVASHLGKARSILIR